MHLVTKSVTTDDDWLDPSWDRPGDTFENDRLTEDCASEDVTNLIELSESV